MKKIVRAVSKDKKIIVENVKIDSKGNAFAGNVVYSEIAYYKKGDFINNFAVKDFNFEEYEEYEDKPAQYQIGIDTFERAKANMTKDEILACVKFNIDKYNWRKKGQELSDLKKIIDYAKLGIEILENK